MLTDHQTPTRLFKHAARFWHRLTSPYLSLNDTDEILHVRLLQTLLISLGLFSLLGVILLELFLTPGRTHYATQWWIFVSAALGMVALYRLSQTGYYGITARFSVLTITIMAFTLSHPVEHIASPEPQLYLIIAVLVSSILLPEHETLLLIIIHALGMRAHALLFPDAQWNNDLLAPITLVSLSVLVAVHYLLVFQRRQYQTLNDHAAQTAAILTAFPDMIFHVDESGVYLNYHAGQGAEPLRPPEEFLGRKISDIFPEPQAIKISNCVREALHTSSMQIITYSLHVNGRERWYEARMIPYTAHTVLAIVRDVSGPYELLHALERSQKTFHAVTEAMPDLIFRFDKSGNVLDYRPSKAGIRLHHEVTPGQNIRDILPDITLQTLTAIERAISQNTIQIFEYRFAVDGTPHIYEVRISASGNDEAIAIIRDMTEQRRSQIQLRESEARYRTLFEDSPISLWEEDFSEVKVYVDAVKASGVTDLANYFFENPEAVTYCGGLIKILNVNQATRDLMQIDIQNTLLDTLGPNADHEWQQAMRREIVSFARGQYRFESETVQTTPNGSKHLTLIAAVAPGYEDTWARVYVSLADITARVQIEDALATSERQLELALEGAELGLWDWNIRTNTLSVNMWWARMIGYTVDEIEPHLSAWDNTLHPDDRERAWAAIHAHQDRITPHYEVEFRMHAKDDTWVWVLARGKVVERDKQGIALRMVGTHLDITSRKTVEEAEREQRAMVEAMHDIASVLSSTLNIEQVLDYILTSISHIIPYDAASIALLENGIAKIVRSQGFGETATQPLLNDFCMPIEDYPTLKYMADLRQPIVIDDITTDPMWVPLEITQTMRSYIGAPICWDQEVVGFLGLQCTIECFYTNAHRERIYAYAAQAAIALRNAQWYETAQRRLAEMEALHSTLLEITSQLQLDELLQLLIEHALQIINADTGGIFLYRPDTKELEWVVSVGEEIVPPGTRIKRGEGLSGQVLQHNEPLTVPNYHEWDGAIPAEWAQALVSVIAVPINWQGHLLGVITAMAPVTNRFTDHDQQILMLFANQAAIAIQNARLFDAEYQQRVLSETLSHTAALINSTLNLDDILHSLLLAVERVVPYEAANILLMDDNFAYVAHHRGYEEHNTGEYMDHLRVNVSLWKTIRHLIETGSGLVIGDTRTSPYWTYNQHSGWIRSEMSVPIRMENRVIGALNLDSATPNTFTHTDIDRVQAFADQTALAINNARLYSEVRSHRDQLEQRVQERTRDLSVRNAIAETLSSSLDTGEMLSGVLRVVTEQLDITGGAIYLPDSAHTTQVMVTSYGIVPEMLNALIVLPDDDSVVWNNPAGTFAPHTYIPAMLSVPIWQKERVQGAIVLVHNEPRAWNDSEKSMLDAIGRQIGVALANARSYDSAVQGEARIRTLLESVTDGLMVFDKNDMLLLMNPAAREMFSFYELSEGGEQRAASLLWRWLRAYEIDFPNRSRIEFALPAAPLNITDPETLRANCEATACALPHDQKAAWPCWLYPRNLRLDESKQCALYAQVRQLAIQAQSATVRDDSSGEILGTVIVLNDVTHFRELDELKGRFVSTVSHELRTPLSTILLQVSMLLKYYDRFEDTERRTMIQEIQEQSQVLRNLIEDILELSRFDDNRSRPQKQWFDLVAASHDVLNSMTLVIRDKAITVDSSRCTGSRYIMGDPNQLKRVLRNLLNNAVKYTPPGGSIGVGLRQDGSQIVWSVSDSGIGIDPNDQEYIFDRFYRAKEAISMASGTGLGLAITKEIVDLHDGYITVDSQPGEGSTFTVYLPSGEIDRTS